MTTLTLESEALPSNARVVAFRGEEGASRLYRFDVHVQLPDDDCAALELATIVGTRASLHVDSEGSAGPRRRSVHGIVGDIELRHCFGGQSLLTVGLVPELHRLTESEHSRMFTVLNVEKVLRTVLDGAGYAGELGVALQEDHPEEPHVCQYRESDFDFVARWLEREGIHFYFDHRGSEEKLVVSDHDSGHEPATEGAVRYHPLAGQDMSADESLQSFRARHAATPRRVRFADYDHVRPALDVSGEAELSDGVTGEIVRHGARGIDPADCARLADIEAQALRCGASTYEASGTVVGLCPGFTFELGDHPDNALNQSYLVIAATHQGASALASSELRTMLGIDFADGYRVTVTVLPTALRYRPALVACWPRIHGIELAVIDGPADSEYAQLDDQGCYPVRFHFDESDLGPGKATTRLRLLEPHAGAPEGFHFPLRKGTEVAVTFLGAEPDRPVIAGAVPNARTQSVVTSERHTQNVIQTGGRTRIQLEDQAGKQHVYMSTPTENTYLHLGEPFNPPSYITLHTDCDCLLDIGTNQDVKVGEVTGGGLMDEVVGTVTETYHDLVDKRIQGLQRTVVGGAVSETYQAKHETTVVGGLRNELDDNGQTTVGFGAREEIFNGGLMSQVFGGLTETYAANLTRTVTGATDEQHNGSLTENVGGAVTEMAASVQEKFGPTTATYASYTWICPSVNIRSSQTTHTYTSQTLHKDNEYKIWPILFEAKGTDGGNTSFKLEIVGSAVSVTGVKAEGADVSIALSGPAVQQGGAKIELGVLKVDVAGLVKNWGK
jgi:type VI secretion system secreted protein VgrG